MNHIELDIMRCAMNNKRCVFPGCNEKRNLIHVPKSKRFQILNTHRIYIPHKSVLCTQHLDCDCWNGCITFECKYTKEYIEEMVDLMRTPPEKHENESLFSSKKIKLNTGLSLQQFNELFNELPTLHRFFLKNTKKAKLALLLYLTRLRTGDRFNRIYENFSISRNTGFKYIIKARIALNTDFVPNNLGLHAMSRDILLESVTNTANTLYLDGEKNQAVLIADGTYIFCNKTMNFSKQRECYSGHKRRHLFKPMVLVTTTGRFVEIYGPYKATENDAKILSSIFDTYATQINEILGQGKFDNKIRCPYKLMNPL